MTEYYKKEEEHDPEKYFKILCDIFAEQENRREIDILKNTIKTEKISSEEGRELKWELKELNKKIQELENKKLSDDEYGELVSKSEAQLKEDIAILRKNNPNTIEGVLDSSKGEKFKELIKCCHDTEWELLKDEKTKKEIREFLEKFLCEVAEANRWEIGLGLNENEKEYPNLGQRIYISNKNVTVGIEPSLLNFKNRSVEEWLKGEKKLDNIRECTELKVGEKLKSKSYDSATIIASLEDGRMDIRYRSLNLEEITFWEKVIAAYY